jgi:hypothetical protein
MPISYISGDPIFEIDAEYEALLTNRLILTPSVEVELPLTDDAAIGHGAFAPRSRSGRGSATTSSTGCSRPISACITSGRSASRPTSPAPMAKMRVPSTSSLERRSFSEAFRRQRVPAAGAR